MRSYTRNRHDAVLTVFEQLALKELSLHADTAARVCTGLSSDTLPKVFDEKMLDKVARLTSAQSVTALTVLRRLEGLGLLTPVSQYRWQVAGQRDVFGKLASMLEAVAFFRQSVHQDRTAASVVLTRPAQPSRLEKALAEFGWTIQDLQLTSEAFVDIATYAKRRFIVMTPFLDEHGGRWLVELLRKVSPEVEKAVILRYIAQPSHWSYPEGYSVLAGVLAELRATVYDYALPRADGSGTETFHAKVILADDDYAYVGSANMNKASLEYSMELGILIRGEAAKTVARVVEAITQICSSQP